MYSNSKGVLLTITKMDTTLRDYFIPRNTAILANFWAVHHDPKYWEDPDVFRPERFLSKDGRSVVKAPNYMPFSLGKRVCPGETMAYMELFLYFVTILQKFDIVFPDGMKPTFDSHAGLTLRPADYEIRFLSYRRWIVLNSAEAIKETLLKPEFLSRPPYGPFALFKKESPFFTSPLHVWQEQRKFVVQSMKDLGLGKSKIEEHVKDEICAIIDVLKSHGGKPMDLKDALAPSMSNNITALVFGVRYPYDHPDRVLLNKNAEDVNKYIGQLGLLSLFPWMRYLPFVKGSKYKTAVKAFDSSQSLFHKLIKEHRNTLDPQNIRDYVDRYLIEMESRIQKDPKTTFNENTLADSATDLFGAGSETVFTSVLWCVYIMASYPDLQKKVQKEIMDVVGPDRMAELLDQKSMPFTYATILEVLRFVTIVPLNLLHYTTVDTNIRDYFIPRKTAVLANFWAVHHDPKYWDDPDSFKPERFLSKDGKSVVKPPNFMPFSLGKRVCPGETMAYMEIFLYFVTILQKFDIVFPDNMKPTFHSRLAISLRPEDYMIRFLSRN